VPATNNSKLSRIEEWAAQYSTLLAFGIIAVALVLRVYYANASYLNGDEAQHFDAARPSTWFEAYHASFSLSHPPLMVMVLHGFLYLGRGILILRLPSIIGGTLALWLTFAWLRRVLGDMPALAGLGFMALSPAAISASTEVRQYGLLLCFVCGALYATERLFTDRSAKWGIIQGIFLLCALMTHYTAVVVLASLGVYVLIRALVDRVPWHLFLTFVATQLTLLATLVWLYFTRVRGLIPMGQSKGSSFNMDYLQHFYYAKGQETPVRFAWRSLSGTFFYMTGAYKLMDLFLIAFFVGVIAILAGRTKAPRILLLLILSPFAVGFVTALLKIFPFGGSRHQTYLLPFLAAGVAASIAWLPRGRALPFFLLGVLLAPFWVIRARPDNDPRMLAKRDMTATIDFIHSNVPTGSTIIVDGETLPVLGYYLAPDNSSVDTAQINGITEINRGGYFVAVRKQAPWIFEPDGLIEQVRDSGRALSIPPSNPLWAISTAWTDSSLVSRVAAGKDWTAKEFGRISVIKILPQER
jgi:uncharacterized membrane protein